MKEVLKTLKKFLEEIGANTSAIDDDHNKRIKNWLSIYQGKSEDHDYYIYNGQKKAKKTMKSLNMPSQSCADLSDFYFNEKLDITIDNENIQDVIKEILKTNDFVANANELMQLVEALGTGAIVPFIDENEELKINYFNATNIIILEGKKKHVKSVLFWSEENVLDGTEMIINCHILTDKGYVIHNRKYTKSENGAYVEKEIDESIRIKETNSFIPQFAMIFTPLNNNIDINSPYGISCYANALDINLAIDRAYDSVDVEVWNGRKRIYVKGGAAKFNIDGQGNMTPIFDGTDTVYYELPGDEHDPMVKSETEALRVDSISEAIQYQLNLWSSKVGLGHNYYKFKDGETYVNTDNVMSSNSDVYRKIKKQENILTNAITDMCYAIAYLLGLAEEFSVSVFYDDSIIEDTNAIRLQAQSELNLGIISKAQYARDVYKLGDDEAIQFITQMNKEIVEETITDGTESDFEE